MTRNWTVAGSLVLGAGCMYVLDPAQGRRRRARLGDRLAHLRREITHGMWLGVRDVKHRAVGLACETNARLQQTPTDDGVLVERVRARLGHVCSNAQAVKVAAHDGRIVLSGPVYGHERDRALAAVGRVRGVRLVEDQLDAQQAPDDLAPSHQARFTLLDENWPPGWRLGLGVAGAGLAAYGLLRPRGPLALVASMVGAALLTRGTTNQPIKRLTGLGAGRRAVDIEKIINIHAPLDKVYGFWSQFTNFPQFMSHVRAIHDRGDGRYHWEVDGPAGMSVGWDATVTKMVPGETIAWKSEPGSTIESTGMVLFQPNDDGGTRVLVRMSYNPVAGMLGHGVARLFGVDPKRQMDDDLARLKTFLETGATPRDTTEAPVKDQVFH